MIMRRNAARHDVTHAVTAHRNACYWFCISRRVGRERGGKVSEHGEARADRRALTFKL
jgi:hypothetical protein